MSGSSSVLTDRLNRLRRQMTQWMVVDGLSRTLLAVAGLACVNLLIDWLFHLDLTQRKILLAINVVIVLGLVWLRCLKPWTRPVSDQALALQIEQHTSGLGERLIAALQLSRLKELPPGASSELVQAAIARGEEEASQVETRSLLDHKRWTLNLLILVIMAGLGGTAVAGLVPATVSIWFDRNVLLADRDWPHDVGFQLVGAFDGTVKCPQGEACPVVAEVTPESTRTPVDVWLEIRGRRERIRMEQVGSDSRRFQLELAAVHEPHELRIIESGVPSGWIHLQPVPRPVIESVKLKALPPAYTRLPESDLSESEGPYELLAGTTLTIEGAASKVLSNVTLECGDHRQSLMLPGDQRFTLTLAPQHLQAGIVSLTVTDTELIPGVMTGETGPLSSASPLTFGLRLKPDQSPVVQFSLSGISSLATAGALIPMQATITDDLLVRSVRLKTRTQTEAAEPGAEQQMDLASPDLPSPAVELRHALELEPLSIPAGSTLSLSVEAEDFNDVTGPGLGRSNVMSVRIVTDEEFRAALLAQERQQAVELEKLVRQQELLATETSALDATFRSDGKATPGSERAQQVALIRNRQKTVVTGVRKIARRLEDLAQEVRNNRIETENGPVQARLTTRMVQPLVTVANEQGEDVGVALDSAQRALQNGNTADVTLSPAIKAQSRMAERLREILARMELSHGFQEAVNLLQEIVREQEAVRRQTEKQQQELLRNLLEGTPRP